jgi:hypothetical protein
MFYGTEGNNLIIKKYCQDTGHVQYFTDKMSAVDVEERVKV